MTKLLLAAALAIAGCVETPSADRDVSFDRDLVAAGDQADEASTRDAQQLRAVAGELGDDTCASVIETEGPCAVACDPDAVLEFVPPGICLDFVCTLEDGGLLTVGACNFDEPMSAASGQVPRQRL